MAGTSTLGSDGWTANGAPQTDFDYKGVGFFSGKPDDEVGANGDLAIDPVSYDVYKKVAGVWTPIVSGPTTVTVQNVDGSKSRMLSIVNGVATLAAADTIVTNADVLPVVNSAGADSHSSAAVVTAGVFQHTQFAATIAMVDNGDATIVEGSNSNALNGGEATLVVAAGVLTAPKLNVSTVTLLSDGAQIAIKAADGISTQPATLIVAAGANNGATLLANIALVPNLLSVVLHKSDGTVSAGNAGLNSPAVLEISGGKIQDVKAGA